MSGVDILFKRMGLNRDIALAGGVLAIIGMLILPESPRWFAIRERFADSSRILDLSRSPEEADFEYKEIVESATTAKTERSHAWRDLKNNTWMRKLLWIGIGLAVVKKIAERHGGTVRVQSTPGEGASFVWSVPKSQAANE